MTDLNIIDFINGKELTAQCLKRMDLFLCYGIAVNYPETEMSTMAQNLQLFRLFRIMENC